MSLAPVTSEEIVHMFRSRPRPVAHTTLVALIGLTLLGGCNSSPGTTSPTGSCTPTPTDPECVNPPNLLTVTIASGVYSPNPVTVKVGQSVNWLNRDTFAHTATDANVFDTGSIPATSAHDVAVTFNTTGTFNYQCMLHPGETGTVVVQP
jgi:plastocyanin